MKRLIGIALLCTAAMTNAWADDIQLRLEALNKVAPGKPFKMLVVPSDGNFLVNKMIVATLKTGVETPHAVEIAELLQGVQPVYLAVTSRNDGIGAATLDNALHRLKGKAVIPQEVAYIGEAKSGEALALKARDIGLTLIVVPFQN